MDERLTELSRFGLQKNANGKQQVKGGYIFIFGIVPQADSFRFPSLSKRLFQCLY